MNKLKRIAGPTTNGHRAEMRSNDGLVERGVTPVGEVGCAQRLDRRAHQVGLVSVAAVGGRTCDSCLSRHRVHREPVVAQLAKQAVRGLEYQTVGLGVLSRPWSASL